MRRRLGMEKGRERKGGERNWVDGDWDKVRD